MSETEKPPSKQPQGYNKYIKESIFVVEQASAGIPVYPGDCWGLHYPESRRQLLNDILDGKIKSEGAAQKLKPDALVFDINDLVNNGFQQVSGRVRDISEIVEYYDYPQFARFIETMRGTTFSLETLEKLYDGIANNRIRKRVYDSIGSTGKRQMEETMKREGLQALQQIETMENLNRVLELLKLDWLSDEMHMIPPSQRDEFLSQLSGNEREIYVALRKQYQEYVQQGSQPAYENLVRQIQKHVPKIEAKKDSGASEALQELEKELAEAKEDMPNPGQPQDPAIPPDDQDEYHTLPPSPDRKEGETTQPFFEITPCGSSSYAIIGHYAAGKKSYFSKEEKTWSKKKQLQPYSVSLTGDKRQKISGITDSGLKAIPIPTSYALDISSLRFKGTQPQFFRDQNGCFYIQASEYSTFSIDFLPEDSPFTNPPIPEDLVHIYTGRLSEETEKAIDQLTGSPVQKAEQARNYLLAHHFYPGDGDLKLAQSLQYTLRNKSTSDIYIKNLDASEYLECYSANTLFIAMLRKAGVASRLVVGDLILQTRADGKAVIDQSTGHAWSEIWDGVTWRRIGATPFTKPEDAKKDKKKNSPKPSEEAQDGGIKNPKPPNLPPKDTENIAKKESVQELDNKEFDTAKNQLNQMKKQLEQIEQLRNAINQKIQDTHSFQDLKDLQVVLQQADLPDDMKKDIEDRLQSKEKNMKDEVVEELEKMAKDGFMEEEKKEQLEKLLEESNIKNLDRVRDQINHENALYYEYQLILTEVMPKVAEWYDRVARSLPTKEEIENDEDSLTQQGRLNKRALTRVRNLYFGTIKNPRVFKKSVEPLFMASFMIDVSGSMQGKKLNDARKLLVFYLELFDRIGQNYGYIKSAINTFSDGITEIKTFDQEYNSKNKYNFQDGDKSTIKMRLMKAVKAKGGTNMLHAIKKAVADLNTEVARNRHYLSALYFFGDGEDTCGNAERIKHFLQLTDGKEQGFDNHLFSATLIGDESQRRTLEEIFGKDYTQVAPDFETLIDSSMNTFLENIQNYVKDKII